MKPVRVGIVLGTRPEAVKLAPLVLAARRRGAAIEPVVISTAQHREMLDPILEVFGIAPDHDLDVMVKGQTLSQITSRVLDRLEALLARERFDVLVIQGDTTTCLATALSAFYHRTPLAHVEAGLRSHDFEQPYPEEMNRCLSGRLATLHFAPTEGARRNLLDEGVDPRRVVVTGNTAVDAILTIAAEPDLERHFPVPDLDPAQRLILVTAHRRESFGEPFARMCRALAEVVERRPDVALLYPVHLNENVRRVVMPTLGDRPRVHLVEPLSYRPFVAAMKRAHLILTDSGGVQEEAPSLGKPVLIMRELTERPECVEVGAARLVGTDPERIVGEALRLLDDPAHHAEMASKPNPFGDGRAAERILDTLEAWWAERHPGAGGDAA